MCIVYKNSGTLNHHTSDSQSKSGSLYSLSPSPWYPDTVREETLSIIYHLSSHYSRAWVSSEPLIGQALSVLAAHWSKFIHFEWVLSKPLWQGCKLKLQSLRNRQFNKYFLIYYEQEFNMFAKKLTLIPVKASSLIFEN